MEVITIESEAFRELILKIEELHEFFRSLPPPPEVKEEDDWLDSNAVCDKLKISQRTLYRLRKERLIGFSSLRGRCRFRLSDVEKILNERVVVSHPETFDQLRQNYKK